MIKQSSQERLVKEVRADYLKRREDRRSLEAQWQLNVNFYLGNQYSYIKSNNSLSDLDKQYFWQEREVFNHITPTVENRISKLLQLSPDINVMPASTDDADMYSAKLSKEIFSSVSNRVDLQSIIRNATTWSEICGTAFYKVIWNNDLGSVFAKNDRSKAIRLGDVDIGVCSPFEIFPDNLAAERIEDVRSLIHAKAVDVSLIKSMYGITVSPEKCYSFSLDNGFNSVGGLGYDSQISKVANKEMNNSCILLEKYCRPTQEYPNGRLTIVAGDKLLYDGELPYKNGESGDRDLPFVKQISNYVPGSFFGASVIERIIPIQRAYNAVRNRKHEYFNRLAMGVLTVESGSVDTDALEQDGLSPGKVLVYRQGSKAPEIMSTPSNNSNFEAEEDRLIDEFKNISGVNDIWRQNYSAFNNLSGTALQLLMEQDEQRLQPTIDEIKSALVKIAKFILRLYKQYAVVPRLLKIAGDNGEIKMHYWDNNEISCDDVVFDSTRSLGETLATKRQMLLDLINAGLMYDEEGKFSQNMRKRCLDLLGFGMWENSTDLHTLHINRAQEENLKMATEDVSPLEIDDHEVHINEHISFILGSEIKTKENIKEIEQRVIAHINEHKKYLTGSEYKIRL